MNRPVGGGGAGGIGLRVLMVVEQAAATGWRYYAGLAAALRTEGVEVHFLNLARSPGFAERVGPMSAGVRELGLGGRYFRSVPGLVRAFREVGPDVVHAQEYIPAAYAAIARSFSRAKPVLVYGRHHSLPLQGRVRWMDRMASRRADAVVVPSDWAGQWLVRQDPEAGQRVRVIHHGVRPPVPLASGKSRQGDGAVDEVRRAFSGATAVVLARLRKEKGHDDALEAWELLRWRGTAVRLVCVGDGPRRLDLEERVKQMKLTDRVSFPGATDDVGAVLASADLVVVPSLSESFGLTAVEAMASGLPVVATRAGALPELVEDRVTGLLVDVGDTEGLADAVQRLVEDPTLRRRLGEAGRARHEAHFTPEVMALHHRDLYTRMVDLRRGSHGA